MNSGANANSESIVHLTNIHQLPRSLVKNPLKGHPNIDASGHEFITAYEGNKNLKDFLCSNQELIM